MTTNATENSKTRLLEILLLIFVTILFYNQAFHFDFVWDDNKLISQNPFLEQVISLRGVFSSTLWRFSAIAKDDPNYYRPLVNLLYLFEYKMWGANAAAFHYANVAFHLICIVLLYFIGLKLGLNRIARFASCLFFSMHPVQASTVAFISCHGDLLAALFSLLTILFWLRKDKYRYLYFLWMFCALLSKEAAIVLPLFLIVGDWLLQKRSLRKAATWYPLLVWLPYLVLHIAAEDHSLLHTTSLAKILTTDGSYRTFVMIGRIFLPRAISPRAYLEEIPLSLNILFHILYASTLVIFFLKPFKNRLLQLFLCWFLIAMFPVGDWINMGLRLSDQLLYLPMIAASLVLGIVIGYRAYFIYVFFAIMVVFLPIGQDQLSIWKDNLTLREYILRFTPKDMDARVDYAVAVKMFRSEDEGCQLLYEILKDIKENDKSTAHRAAAYNFGNCFLDTRPDIAERYYRQAILISKNDNFWMARNNLVITLLAQHKLQQAKDEVQLFIKNRPDIFVSWKMAALVHIQLEEYSEAIVAVNKGLKLSPTNPGLLKMSSDIAPKIK
jgi:tetratricopeptide (TPR) repeat protein